MMWDMRHEVEQQLVKVQLRPWDGYRALALAQRPRRLPRIIAALRQVIAAPMRRRKVRQLAQ